MPVRLVSPLATQSCRLLLPTQRHFHNSQAWRAAVVDHYHALGLEPNASQTAIKKQFYTLSKTHHPDHNPNDPSASERFVKISEAYAVLGNSENRQKYDRDTGRTTANPRTNVRRGSHSSSAYGARPASGLSRRRTQFRGPPPSFYRSGGWGHQGERRQSQADAAATAGAAGTAGGGGFGGGGFGPGQAQSGWDVPHFDREAHLRTQEQQQRRWMLRRRTGEEDGVYGGAGMLFQFLLVGGVISLALVLPSLFERDSEQKRKRES